MSRIFWLSSVLLLLLLFGCDSSIKDIDVIQKRIQLDSTEVTMYLGDTVQLGYTCNPEELKDSSFVWVSKSPVIAKNTKNQIVALSIGKTQIITYLKSNPTVSDTCTVNVLKNGVAARPYLIYTKKDFYDMRDKINNSNGQFGESAFKLMSDLDFSGEPNWLPIGPTTLNAFKGIFDGNNKVIRNIKGDFSDINVRMDYLGLFGYTNGAQIVNLTVDWSSMKNWAVHTGGIVGFMNNGLVSNCQTTGSIVPGYYSGRYFGGIVGTMKKGDIINCHSSSYIKSNYSGGIVCHLLDGRIVDCYSTGEISGYYDAGGITAIMDTGLISTCYSTGKVANASHSGGISANMASGKIEKCYSTGLIQGYINSGGISGSIKSGVILQCNATSTVSWGTSSGGIVGEYAGGTVDDCHFTGVVSGSVNVGGIAGYAEGQTLTNCFSSVRLNFSNMYDQYVGGIVGFGGTLIKCHSTGSIAVSSATNSYVGGISGKAETVVNCYSDVAVESVGHQGTSYVGGISGECDWIINSTHSGNVSSTGINAMAGGIAGKAGSILNCCSHTDILSYSTADASSTFAFSGGIAGIVSSKILNNIALNTSISTKYVNAKSTISSTRIAWSNAVVTSDHNFAMTSMIVKKELSSTSTTLSDFTNNAIHGSDLAGVPVTLLNEYVTANPTINGWTLSKWNAPDVSAHCPVLIE